MTSILWNNKRLDIETATCLQYVFIAFIPLVNYIIGVWFGSGGLYLSLIIVFSLTLYKILKRDPLKVTPLWIVYILILIVYGILTRHSMLNSIQFILYILLPAFVAISKINMHRFIKMSTYSSLILFLVFPTFIRDLNNNGGRLISINGISYAVLPVLVAGLFHFVLYRKADSNIILRLCYLLDIILGALLIVYSNRGVVLSILIAIYLVFTFKHKERLTFKHGIAISLSFLVIAVLVLNFQSILTGLVSITSKYGIEIAFINKFANLNRAQDLTNGRSEIGIYVLEHIGESFLWGHGLSTITYNSGGTIVYPHNMIYQLLYDGGLILSIPIFSLLFYMIVYLFKGKNENLRILILFFSIICIPKMMFSSDIWFNPAFWLFVFAMFNHSGEIHNSIQYSNK